MSDPDSWLSAHFGHPEWPLLFDDELQPKPAFYGFNEALVE